MTSRPRTIFSGTSGLYNRVDAFRAKVDYRTNIRAVVECQNVMTDDTGRLDRVPGFEQVYGLPVHSLYSCGEYALCVSAGSICRINHALWVEPVHDLFYPDAEMSFCRVNTGGGHEEVYFANGYEAGIISDGEMFREWRQTPAPVQDTSRAFSGPPAGDLVFIAQGRMWVCSGPDIYYSEPYSFGCFDLAFNRLHLDGDCRFIAEVSGGIWLSDSKGVYFLDGIISPATGEFPKKIIKSRAAAVRNAITPVALDEFPFENMGGAGWLMLSEAGAVCLLGPDGYYINLTGADVEFRDTKNRPISPRTGNAFSYGGRSFFSFDFYDGDLGSTPDPVATDETDMSTADYTERIAGENIGGHRMVATDDTGRVVYADRTNREQAFRILGMTSGAAAAGMSVTVVTEGPITDTSLNLIPQKPVFLGRNGGITQTFERVGFQLVVGFAVDKNTLRVRIDENPLFFEE